MISESIPEGVQALALLVELGKMIFMLILGFELFVVHFFIPVSSVGLFCRSSWWMNSYFIHFAQAIVLGSPGHFSPVDVVST